MPNGIIIIDKPEGWTSMDVCAKLRGILSERRIGHGGTLDPMATGVLPVFVGSATRAVEFAEKGDKEYIAGLLLGRITNTQDTSGETLEERPVELAPGALEAVLKQFAGDIQQIPPMYSAIKIGGKKLYELARKGQEVERKPRPVTIREIAVLEGSGTEYLLRIRCSKGTYVRTLCHDIGQALGCGGCMSSLRRTMAAGFTIDQAVTLEQAQEQGAALLLPVDEFFSGCPAYALKNPNLERLCRNGNALRVDGLQEGTTYRVYGEAGDFLCISRFSEGTLTSIKNFFGGKE